MSQTLNSDFLNDLWECIVDAICEVFDCPEASAMGSQDSISNVTVNYPYPYMGYDNPVVAGWMHIICNHSEPEYDWKNPASAFTGGITA